MHLTPREIEKLMLHNAGFLAQKRYARGLLLNYVESVALLSAQLLEFIREGWSVAKLMDKGKNLLGFKDVMPGVADMLGEVQVEGTFPDGSKLVTVHYPICRETGDPELALYGSGLTRRATATQSATSQEMTPGQIKCDNKDVPLNLGRTTVSLTVLNNGDRPVQVGSHYPFFETNPALLFDRARAYGMRLNIPAGTAVRFEPGDSKTVELVEIAGDKIVHGGNGLINGSISEDNRNSALKAALQKQFSHKESDHAN